jgi:hypothetical protein
LSSKHTILTIQQNRNAVKRSAKASTVSPSWCPGSKAKAAPRVSYMRAQLEERQRLIAQIEQMGGKVDENMKNPQA